MIDQQKQPASDKKGPAVIGRLMHKMRDSSYKQLVILVIGAIIGVVLSALAGWVDHFRTDVSDYKAYAYLSAFPELDSVSSSTNDGGHAASCLVSLPNDAGFGSIVIY